MSAPVHPFLAGTASDAASKLGQSGEAILIFFGVGLIIFVAAGRATGRLHRPMTITVLLGPALILLAVGLVIPAIRTIYLSFYNDDSTAFISGKNYTWAFTNHSAQQALINTLLWILIAPIVATVLGLLMAVLVDRLRWQSVYKSLIFMPMAISFVGASIIWKFVYDYRAPGRPQTGLLSEIVMKLGWHNPPDWILTHPLNNFLLMVIMVWSQTGFAMVVLSAAIKAIPDDIIDAAKVDGARGLAMAFRITLPMIRNTLIVVLTTVMIITLKLFDIIRTMTGGNFGTEVLANDMYSQTFTNFDTGKGSALAVILFAGVLPLVGYNIVLLRRERQIR
ncbi:sugar ABC transporter permease [Actinocrinis puniceicyclus]|uniref:Sugar ABC transporter permease n=1 Tax=Actinocrinis puniceicyclus TaxID=977794 RepID=A0A8J7WJ69_9ACTN|nr:sugar ABC transporter permease [Actinocrinis puniceicyclus]MBS2963221.1 sugar ABC transporter permease [Actinocrinis puniceicyclus]